jgi:hypothetical protein
MFVSRHRNAGQNCDIKMETRLLNLSQLKYLGMTVTNENLIQEQIKRILNSGEACYHSVKSLLSSHLLSKNITNSVELSTAQEAKSCAATQ